MVDPEAIRQELAQVFPDGEIRAEDYTGGGDHFSVSVMSEAFSGKSLVERHQMVYRALAGLMPQIHALQLKTVTSTES